MPTKSNVWFEAFVGGGEFPNGKPSSAMVFSLLRAQEDS
jgi:hypothetical protein